MTVAAARLWARTHPLCTCLWVNTAEDMWYPFPRLRYVGHVAVGELFRVGKPQTVHHPKCTEPSLN